jgi:hypothetical protein
LSLIPLAAGAYWVFEETKPVLTRANNIIWEVPNGTFSMPNPGVNPRVLYVRGAQMDYLQTNAASMAEPDMWYKRSNEQYFRWVDDVFNYPFKVLAGPDGSARLDADYKLKPGAFFPHFPYGSYVQWLADSEISIRGDHFDPANSFLNQTTNVALFQFRGCLDQDAGCSPDLSFALHHLHVDGSRLNFTRDGGLSAQGNLAVPTFLEWGEFKTGPATNYAHQAYTFDRAGFHMPGIALRGDQKPGAVANDAHRPGVLLLTGVTTNLAGVERPQGAGYASGLADYGGMNFRVVNNGAKQAKSFLGGTATGEYQLKGRSKYYARWGGVSGIHDSVPGSFPANLTVYGYPFTFSNYGFSFLGSRVWESRTEGSLSLPWPSGFTQAFKELKLTCFGDLLKAEPPGSDPEKVLQYWLADFKTGAINFEKMPGSECGPGGGKLVLGVTAWMSNIEQPFFGRWGFEPNGRLISHATGLPGVDSRLQPPNNIRLQGPAGEKYHFVPVSKSYLNHYDNFPNPNTPVGWANLAGRLDVPFFEDLKVHLQTGAKKTNLTDQIFMMGGWPAEGWLIGGQSFFDVAPTDPPFDPGNRGFPAGVTRDTYRRVTPDGDKFAPRAQRVWAKVVEFDLPLDWSDGTRSFKSARSVTKPVALLDVDQDVKYLSAQHAELNFGVKFKGLPQINLANIAFNELAVGNQLKGVANAVTAAATAPIRNAIEQGFKGMDGLLQPLGDELLEPVLAHLVDPIVDQLYGELVTAYGTAAGDVAAFKASAATLINNRLTAPAASARAQLKQNLVGLAVNPGSVNLVGEIDQRITALETAIDGLVNQVGGAKGLFAQTAGKRTKALSLIQNLIGELAPAHSAGATVAKLEAILADVESAFAQLELELNQRRAQLNAFHAQLNGGALRTELADLLNTQAGIIDNLTTQAAGDLTAYFNGLHYAAGSPFTQLGPEQIKQHLRQKIRQRFHASTVSSALQQKMRARFYDLDAQVRGLTDSLFQKANDAIIDLLTETLADVDLGFTDFLGPVSSIMQGTKIRGYAHLKGDSLTELRLDGTFRWSVPDKLEFGAFLRIRELDAKVDYGCVIAAGETITQVDMGASNVPLGWGPTQLKANLGFGFSLKNTGAGYRPHGFTGNLHVFGGLNFEAFKIGGLKAMVAVGGDQNFFAGAMEDAVFGDFAVSGGIFFGRACSPEPLIFIDPEVGEFLGTGTFTGAYAFGEGWAPIFGGSCLLKISAGVGGGAFYFAEGPTFGGKLVLGISGEALCLVSVKARVSMIGSKTGTGAGGLKYAGKGTLSGKAGACPFCVKFKKSVSVTYDKKFSVKF